MTTEKTIEELKELWGEELFSVFAEHIDQNGWLTSDWARILEQEVPRLDEDYNDNPEYSDTYSRMYNKDFEESQDGLLLRPIDPNK